MSNYYDDNILDMNDDIHWVNRKKDNFLEEHPDINTFIIINENPENQIDYVKTSHEGTIRQYDNIFTADIIDEYKSRLHNIIHLYGTIGYSADTQDVEFIFDKKANKIYVCGTYRMLSCEFEQDLYKDTFEICPDKYWGLEKEHYLTKVKEINVDKKYEEIDYDGIPYYRYPRTKDGLTIPRIIYSVFKIFSNPDIPKENKPKIVVPYYYNFYK